MMSFQVIMNFHLYYFIYIYIGLAETRVTYLPDGAVVIVFPTNLSISIESGGHPILANQHRMHFKRKLIGPNKQIHKLEWRFYVRRKGRSRQSKIVEKVGHRMRVGPHFSRHVSMHDEHEDLGYKGKALLVCPFSVVFYFYLKCWPLLAVLVNIFIHIYTHVHTL